MKKLIFYVALLLLCSCTHYPHTDNSVIEEQLSIYLVRHAEKTTERPDPELTSEGKIRADVLASELIDVPLTAIYSSNYRRTLDTAAPIAKLQNIEVELYDPSNLEIFADMIKKSQGSLLIVGHSNTTPQLTAILGGDPVSEIDEATEYDRLYRVQIFTDKTIRSELMRYGKPYIPVKSN